MIKMLMMTMMNMMRMMTMNMVNNGLYEEDDNITRERSEWDTGNGPSIKSLGRSSESLLRKKRNGLSVLPFKFGRS